MKAQKIILQQLYDRTDAGKVRLRYLVKRAHNSTAAAVDDLIDSDAVDTLIADEAIQVEIQ